MPSCLVLPVPPPSLLCAYTRYVSLMPEIFSTFLCRNTGVAGEDVHLVTMAEKMQPALLVTAHPAKKGKEKMA